MSKTYKTKMVEQRVIAFRNCDNCRASITDGEELTLVSGHNQWGNDSVESQEFQDACSVACLQALLGERVEHWIDERESAYFNIGRLNHKQARELSRATPSH